MFDNIYYYFEQQILMKNILLNNMLHNKNHSIIKSFYYYKLYNKYDNNFIKLDSFITNKKLIKYIHNNTDISKIIL